MATPDFTRRWFPEGATVEALERAPVVVFDRKDDLQDRYLRARSRRRLDPPRHHIPGSTAYANAVRLGLGWGMLPPQQSAEWNARGEVVLIDEERHVDVTLYWQQWSLASRALDVVAQAVRSAASIALER